MIIRPKQSNGKIIIVKKFSIKTGYLIALKISLSNFLIIAKIKNGNDTIEDIDNKGSAN